tara:strand:+ start:391 stop:522 length:132 start_codon:yes stop_codon:yes gene_type:complete
MYKRKVTVISFTKGKSKALSYTRHHFYKNGFLYMPEVKILIIG